MIVIFILVGFGSFFDSVSFHILERHKRRKAASLRVASVISAILIEDFAWFIFRWLPLDNDPKRGLLMQISDWTTHNMSELIIQVIFVWWVRYTILVSYCRHYCMSSFTMHSKNQKKQK
jgi:hypothetical protein